MNHAHMLTLAGGGVGMAPAVGPTMQERVTHIKPISVRKENSLINSVATKTNFL
jgi:hypothetical protein